MPRKNIDTENTEVNALVVELRDSLLTPSQILSKLCLLRKENPDAWDDIAHMIAQYDAHQSLESFPSTAKALRSYSAELLRRYYIMSKTKKKEGHDSEKKNVKKNKKLDDLTEKIADLEHLLSTQSINYNPDQARLVFEIELILNEQSNLADLSTRNSGHSVANRIEKIYKIWVQYRFRN